MFSFMSSVFIFNILKYTRPTYTKIIGNILNKSIIKKTFIYLFNIIYNLINHKIQHPFNTYIHYSAQTILVKIILINKIYNIL